jgi:hypothetical protein
MSTAAKIFIDGQFRVAEAAQPVIEAATGEALGDGASATEAENDAAVAAARAALPTWQSASPDHRAEVLTAFAAALDQRARGTDELVTRENGMPMSLSRGANGRFPAALVRYYAQLITDTPIEEIRPSMIGHTVVRREAVGVVAAIVPWNYPQALAAFRWRRRGRLSGGPPRCRQGDVHRVDGGRAHHRRGVRAAAATSHPRARRQVRGDHPRRRGSGRHDEGTAHGIVRQQWADVPSQLADSGSAITLRRSPGGTG